MELLIFYLAMCYLMALVAAIQTRHMPWLMAVIAPISVPITIAFIYADKLNDTF